MNTIQIENAKTKFFSSKEHYLAFKKAWAEKARSKSIDSVDIVLYNLLRGKLSTRGFSPIVNKVKLANGAAEYGAYENSLWLLRNWLAKNQERQLSPEAAFEGTIKKEMLILLHSQLR